MQQSVCSLELLLESAKHLDPELVCTATIVVPYNFQLLNEAEWLSAAGHMVAHLIHALGSLLPPVVSTIIRVHLRSICSCLCDVKGSGLIALQLMPVAI